MPFRNESSARRQSETRLTKKPSSAPIRLRSHAPTQSGAPGHPDDWGAQSEAFNLGAQVEADHCAARDGRGPGRSTRSAAPAKRQDEDHFGSGAGSVFSAGLRNQRLVPSFVLKKFNSSAVVFLEPDSLGCRRSARTSVWVHVSPSCLRGVSPCAHRYGPHNTNGACTRPRAGSKLSCGSPAIWPSTTHRVPNPDSYAFGSGLPLARPDQPPDAPSPRPHRRGNRAALTVAGEPDGRRDAFRARKPPWWGQRSG